MCKTKKDLQSAVAKYRRLKVEEDAIKEQLADLKEEIFEYLDDHNIQPKEKVKGPNYIISFSICQSSTFDQELLKIQLGDDLSGFKKFSSYRRLTVK